MINLDALAIPASLRSYAEQVKDTPDALSQIAIRLLEAHDIPIRDRAICALALRAHAPLERLVWAATDDIVYSGIPFWHWSMVHDAERNTAYICHDKSVVHFNLGDVVNPDCDTRRH